MFNIVFNFLFLKMGFHVALNQDAVQFVLKISSNLRVTVIKC